MVKDISREGLDKHVSIRIVKLCDKFLGQRCSVYLFQTPLWLTLITKGEFIGTDLEGGRCHKTDVYVCIGECYNALFVHIGIE